MEKWLIYAIISMIFAGFTSVIAKLGLKGISGDLGLAIRTIFVFLIVTSFTIITTSGNDLKGISPKNIMWLGISAVTTSLSWIFYYRAIKIGEVSSVALIDKGSVLVSLLMAWLILGENITLNKGIGATLIIGGLLFIMKG